MGVSVQNGEAELFISNLTGDSCVIRSGDDGNLEFLLPHPQESTKVPEQHTSASATPATLAMDG